MLGKPRFLPAGESALVVEFGATIDLEVHDCVVAFDEAIRQADIEGITETVPTYRSLMIHFDPRRLTLEALIDAVAKLPCAAAPARSPRRRWHIPACYDAPHGEDLAEAAALLGLPQERVVSLHLGAIYRVYLYGFAPGWMFLGGLAPELALPRRAVPRAPVPEGSLLVAGGQALIASCAMPSGWYGLGRTPVKTFDRKRERVFLANIGDEICFERIDPVAFGTLCAQAEAGELVAWGEFLDES
jgi:KipI family sensor histidine kinase inhibitor